MTSLLINNAVEDASIHALTLLYLSGAVAKTTHVHLENVLQVT